MDVGELLVERGRDVGVAIRAHLVDEQQRELLARRVVGREHAQLAAGLDVARRGAHARDRGAQGLQRIGADLGLEARDPLPATGFLLGHSRAL